MDMRSNNGETNYLAVANTPTHFLLANHILLTIIFLSHIGLDSCVFSCNGERDLDAPRCIMACAFDSASTSCLLEAFLQHVIQHCL